MEKTRRENAVAGTDIEIKLKNNLTQKNIALECSAWIRQKVEIRSLVKPDFLHGKAYIMQNPGGKDSAVVGSSNFTVSGLGLKGHSNMELNIVSDEPENIKELLSWFDEIWDHPDMVEDVKEQVLENISHLFVENSPEFLYFVTIYNIFKLFFEEMDEEDIMGQRTGFADTRIWNMLYNFQKDGVIGAINKLEHHGGCILADSVGLGKTFEALAVIKYYELKNDRVLVLAPKKLRENWKSGDINLETLNWGNYDLVVIDESHNFRNNPPVKGRLTRYQKLMQVARIIHAAILYPLFIIFCYQHEVCFSTALKRLNKNDPTSVVLGDINISPWLDPVYPLSVQQAFLDSLALKTMPFDNFYRLYLALDNQH